LGEREIGVTVRYFAMLREQRGASSEEMKVAPGTAGRLYADLAERHGLSAPLTSLRIAVNHAWALASHPLAEGDIVAFIPPVSGG